MSIVSNKLHYLRIALIFVAALFVGSDQVKQRIDWCNIVPFQSTRAEIERVLGPATRGTGYVLSYETENDRITVWYGGVNARTESPCTWVLPENTVLSFVYAPKKKLPLAQLNVDLTKFKQEKAVEMVNGFYYYNPADGLTLTTRVEEGQEMFLSLERDPDQALRQKYCKEP